MQREFVGRGQSIVIADELDRIEAKRILLVHGNDSYQNCGAKHVLEPQLDKFSVVSFSDFTPNPDFDEVMAGVAIFKENACDTILAVGGGSALDLAKSINALQAHPGNEHDIAVGNVPLTDPLVPLIAVPTTAGTGSEATHFAVIYVDGKKYSVAAPSLIPDVAILDPIYVDALPSYITACSGFDALCQSIESYWAVGGTDESRENAARAIRLLLAWLPEAVNEGSSLSRDKVMIAANLAEKL